MPHDTETVKTPKDKVKEFKFLIESAVEQFGLPKMAKTLIKGGLATITEGKIEQYLDGALDTLGALFTRVEQIKSDKSLKSYLEDEERAREFATNGGG
jgi:hypothetical protein